MAALTVDQVHTLFAQEASVRLAHLAQLLLSLEQADNDADVHTLIGSVFREVHTLKGSSAVAGLDDVSARAHELEELVDALRTGQRQATPDVVDALLAGADELTALISAAPGADTTAPSPANDPKPVGSAKPGQGRAATSNAAPAARPAPARTRPAKVVRPAADAEPKSASARDPAPVAGANLRSAAARSSSAAPAHGGVIMVPTERLEELTRLVGESASAHLRIGRMLKDRFGIDPASCTEFNELSRSLNDLQDRAMRTQMVPVATVTDQLRRVVRDLSRAQGKDIRWETTGGDTEMDRGVLNQLTDCLLHLVRNAADHGVEAGPEREAVGKKPYGTIRLHAMQLGSEVIIAVSDDGRGIDTARVAERAARHGIDTDGMTEEDLLRLTFHPGLSTTTSVTDVSGRGVGLDVVKTNVEAAHGRVEVRSEVGLGTEFRIIVPITLAVLRCLLVDAGGQRFALPFHRVVLSHAAGEGTTVHAEGRRVIWVDGQPVPLSVLTAVLASDDSAEPGGPIVVLADTSRRHAFQVDALVGQRDVVLGALSRTLPHLPALAGASVEPDGSVLVVLDPPGLIARARQHNHVTTSAASTRALPTTARRILVVDDALTVRELQRSILERAGFQVCVATDGRQALATLAEEPSDLVLTDVEMPTMGGFALTEAIRANPALANIPVLILTSRSSEADRQRGLDAGADGYIVKSGFDEARLLSAVNRLLGAPA